MCVVLAFWTGGGGGWCRVLCRLGCTPCQEERLASAWEPQSRRVIESWRFRPNRSYRESSLHSSGDGIVGPNRGERVLEQDPREERTGTAVVRRWWFREHRSPLLSLS